MLYSKYMVWCKHKNDDVTWGDCPYFHWMFCGSSVTASTTKDTRTLSVKNVYGWKWPLADSVGEKSTVVDVSQVLLRGIHEIKHRNVLKKRIEASGRYRNHRRWPTLTVTMRLNLLLILHRFRGSDQPSFRLAKETIDCANMVLGFWRRAQYPGLQWTDGYGRGGSHYILAVTELVRLCSLVWWTVWSIDRIPRLVVQISHSVHSVCKAFLHPRRHLQVNSEVLP